MLQFTRTDNTLIYINAINVNAIVQTKKSTMLHMVGGMQVQIKEPASQVALLVDHDCSE